MEPGNDLRQPRVEGGVIGAGHHPAHIQPQDPVGQLLVLLLLHQVLDLHIVHALELLVVRIVGHALVDHRISGSSS